METRLPDTEDHRDEVRSLFQRLEAGNHVWRQNYLKRNPNVSRSLWKMTSDIAKAVPLPWRGTDTVRDASNHQPLRRRAINGAYGFSPTAGKLFDRLLAAFDEPPHGARYDGNLFARFCMATGLFPGQNIEDSIRLVNRTATLGTSHVAAIGAITSSLVWNGGVSGV